MAAYYQAKKYRFLLDIYLHGQIIIIICIFSLHYLQILPQ